MEPKKRFLNFPIQLLQGFMDHPRNCFSDIFDYAVFKMVFSEEADYVNLDEFMEGWEVQIQEGRACRIFKNGKILYESFCGTNSPETGIHLNTYYRIRDETDEFKLICFLAFTAFKTIIQNKRWCKSYNPLLLARMAGYPSSKYEGELLMIPDIISHWMKPKSDRRKRVFKYLEKYDGLVYLPKARGIIFSLTCSFKELVYYTEEKKAAKEISELEIASYKKQTIEEIKAEFRELIKTKKKN